LNWLVGTVKRALENGIRLFILFNPIVLFLAFVSCVLVAFDEGYEEDRYQRGTRSP
jgi:hypothetical protein